MYANIHRYRNASPHAWRRLRGAIGPGEAPDIARDIAAIAGGDPELIEWALTGLDWDDREQA